MTTKKSSWLGFIVVLLSSEDEIAPQLLLFKTHLKGHALLIKEVRIENWLENGWSDSFVSSGYFFRLATKCKNFVGILCPILPIYQLVSVKCPQKHFLGFCTWEIHFWVNSIHQSRVSYRLTRLGFFNGPTAHFARRSLVLSQNRIFKPITHFINFIFPTWR